MVTFEKNDTSYWTAWSNGEIIGSILRPCRKVPHYHAKVRRSGAWAHISTKGTLREAKNAIKAEVGS